jgi:hypothetical protein
MIADQLINSMGEGSEKVQYFLGRNANALNQLTALLVEDPGGVKAAVFLGQQKERLTKPKKMKSMAPAPSAENKGDEVIGSGNAARLKKAYDKAHSDGKLQNAYDAKKAAKQAGVDTSKW